MGCYWWAGAVDVIPPGFSTFPAGIAITPLGIASATPFGIFSYFFFLMLKFPIAPSQEGGEVEPPYFVSWKEGLDDIMRGISSLSQNYLIVGPRRTGKSSLLKNMGMILRVLRINR